jgi:hypothetical protein
MVQAALDHAVPPDLPSRTEQELRRLGRQVWTAEVTGTGRSQWPAYFTDTRPSARYTRVRIQAAIARRDAARDDAGVVHLVWAGADPSGVYRDGRTASVRFIRREATWTPER